jgi:phospholipase/carboxylesterase
VSGPGLPRAETGADTIATYRERPADGPSCGLLILHHGRGTDESDLLTLGEVLDPDHRLHVVTPRAPLQVPGVPGYHWYLVPRVGHPDPETFALAFAALGAFHDELWTRTGVGPERTLLAGFSMGAVMSYALGLAGGRPRPAGIMAFSGFLPTVAGWSPALESRQSLPVFASHGSQDAVIGVELGRAAAELLREGGLDVDYHESQAGHRIDPRELPAAAAWVTRRFEGATAGGRRG